MRRTFYKLLLSSCLSFIVLASQSAAIANNYIEYQIKTAFIYNFIAFTQWPNHNDKNLNLCIYGDNYFGEAINQLQSKFVNNRYIKVAHINNPKELKACQVIFFSKSVRTDLSHILKTLQNEPILTLADNQHAISQGVMINMDLVDKKIVFDINLAIARKSKLNISSKLLQLAVNVYQ